MFNKKVICDCCEERIPKKESNDVCNECLKKIPKEVITNEVEQRLEDKMDVKKVPTLEEVQEKMSQEDLDLVSKSQSMKNEYITLKEEKQDEDKE